MKSHCKYTFIAAFAIAQLAVFNIGHAQPAESPSAADPGSAVEPDSKEESTGIRIRQAGTTTIKEYQQQGRTYRVEVAPKNTPAYILSDQDGDGNLNSSDTGIDNDVVVPEWTIGNW